MFGMFCKTPQAADIVVPATSAEEYAVMKQDVRNGDLAVATFAGGCFWCTESFFLEDEGVKATQVGYTDGDTKNPTYEQVSSKTTGHAEALEVIYDPSVISYERLLELFFESHDPTQLNRQGPDIGPQYRGGIYYHTEEQREKAAAKIKELNESGKYDKPLVTDLKPASDFYRAEEYHQRYYLNKGIDKTRLKEWKSQ